MMTEKYPDTESTFSDARNFFDVGKIHAKNDFDVTIASPVDLTLKDRYFDVAENRRRPHAA